MRSWGNAPDVVVLAECRDRLAESIGERMGVQVYRASDVCIATHLPVVEWLPRNPRDFWELAGSGAIGRLVVRFNGTELVIGGVHLETPRGALEALAKFAWFSFPGAAVENRALRNAESQAARSWIASAEEDRPLIVAGDFNLVHESAIYRRWWGDLSNAFNDRGLGLGWTKRTSRFGVRIDHILAGNGVRTTGVTLGPRLGSDHHMLIATLAVPTASGR